MADTVEFTNAFFRDDQWPISLEDSVRLTCAYAGVHSFDFQRLVDEDMTSVANWTATACAGSVSNDDLFLTGGTPIGTWGTYQHDEDVPPSFVATFDYVAGDGGFFFEGFETDRRCFVLWFGSAGCGSHYTDANGVATEITRNPTIVSPLAKIQVVVRFSLDSVDEDRKWLEAGLWVDGQLYTAFARDIGGTSQDWAGDRIGFVVGGTNTLTVDNLRVSEIHREVHWTLIDPGQTVGSGMSRAIGSTRVTYMCRYDNTLRVWRPGDRDADWVIEDGRVGKIDDKRRIDTPTHVRVQAAIHEADGFDDDGNMTRMHRFILYNDPNIMTETEAYFEAARVIHDHGERNVIARIYMPPSYLVEPNDRITYGGNDYRVATVSTSVQIAAGRQIKVAQVIDCQQYLVLP